MLFIGRWLLPKNRVEEPQALTGAEEYLAELLVEPRSPWIGRQVSAAGFARDFDLTLAGLRRGGQLISVNKPGTQYAAGDSLRVRGSLERILALAEQEGLTLHRPRKSGNEPAAEAPDNDSPAAAAPAAKKLLLAEVVVLVTSGLIGQTLKQARFAERFETIVLALRRRGALRERPSATPLRAGDVLVVEGEADALKRLAETRGFLVIGTPAHPEQRPGKLLLTLLTLVAVITVAALGWAPIVTTATAGCAVLMLTGCLRPREAYQAIDLRLVFLLAGSLALGVALEKTGLTALLAKSLAGLTGITGPYLLLVGFFILAMLISEMMSNSGTVALLAPLTISTAAQMGINPMPLLVAVTFGASAAFAMPIGYQTSLMIYGPGGYRFRDFLHMGIALDLIVAALALALIPLYWPLQ
jgi:di/tricarboxylate transporter